MDPPISRTPHTTYDKYSNTRPYFKRCNRAFLLRIENILGHPLKRIAAAAPTGTCTAALPMFAPRVVTSVEEWLRTSPVAPGTNQRDARASQAASAA